MVICGPSPGQTGEGVGQQEAVCWLGCGVTPQHLLPAELQCRGYQGQIASVRRLIGIPRSKKSVCQLYSWEFQG